MECIQIFQIFTAPRELDRAAGDFADGERRTAPGIAIQFGQDDTGESKSIIEMFRHRDRLLTESGIRHQEDFAGAGHLLDLHQFPDHGFIDLQPAGGVNDQIIRAGTAGFLQGVHGEHGNVLRGAVRIDRHTNRFRQNFQLIDGSRAVHVRRGKLNFFAFFLQVESQFSGGGGLPAAVETDHHDHVRFRTADKLRFAAAHELDQFVIDDLHRLLTGRHTLEDFRPEAAFPHLFDKIFRNGNIHIRFQQCLADIVHGFSNIGFGQCGLSTQAFQGSLQPVGQ